MARNDPLRAYLRVQLQADADLKRIFRRAATDARAQIRKLPDNLGGNVRRAQLQSTIRELEHIQRGVWTDNRGDNVVDITQAASVRARETATETADALLGAVYADVPDRIARPLRDGSRAAAREGIRADTVRQRRALSTRVYRTGQNTMHSVETTIRSGILRNLSAEELSGEVFRYIDPNTPGGASYAALRLARTEINNAYHTRQIENGQRPEVNAIIWNLSGSHKVPDQCNVYAKHRLYKPDAVPDKPHPQCLCYLTYDLVDADDLVAAFERGDFDATLAEVAPTPPPRKAAPAPAKPKRDVPRNNRINKSVQSGVVSSEKLTGGRSAETSKVTFKDGTVGVRKIITDASAKRQQDAEELVPLLARMMGLNAPEVTRIDENTTIQEFLPGNVAMSALPWLINAGTPQAKKLSASARVKAYRDSDHGWLMSVMDQVTGNQDRHDGNWLVGENEGEIAAVIDHGLAYDISDWRTARHDRMNLSEAYIFRTRSEFTKQFAKSTGEQTNIDFHPEDLDAIKEMMTALRSEYETRGRLDWWEFSMKQIEALRPFAKGKKRRIK